MPKESAKESAGAFDAAIEALLVLYASDVVCYPAPGWARDPLYRGHDGFRKLSAIWSENVDDAAVEVHEVRDLKDRVLVLAEFTGRPKDSGTTIRQPFGVVNADLREDGKVGEAHFFLSWEEAREAVGLAE